MTGLTNGKTYGFRIRAVNTAGRPGLPSAEVRVTLRQAPLKPTGVTATPGHGQVTLTWDNPDDATITRWQVQQKEGDGSYGAWMDVPNSTASTRSHTVTGLTNGATYGFRIRAVNAAGKGAVSDEVTATPLQRPSKPTGVTATPGHGQVTLTWDNPDDATITRWEVRQKQGSGSYGPWRDVPASNASTTSHTVTGLTNGTAYSFRIRAVNAGGNWRPIRCGDGYACASGHGAGGQGAPPSVGRHLPHPAGHGHRRAGFPHRRRSSRGPGWCW